MENFKGVGMKNSTVIVVKENGQVISGSKGAYIISLPKRMVAIRAGLSPIRKWLEKELISRG